LTTPTIAVVNDDTAFLNLMYELLTDEGYDCWLHTVGSTAYERIREDMPDLVILDIRMDNEESGWQVLDMLRLDPKTHEVPVIVCSADTLQLRGKEQRLEDKHATALEKPFDLPELLAKVRRFVGSSPGKASFPEG
jgi:two-component system, sensor histidine kinase and response regulator